MFNNVVTVYSEFVLNAVTTFRQKVGGTKGSLRTTTSCQLRSFRRINDLGPNLGRHAEDAGQDEVEAVSGCPVATARRRQRGAGDAKARTATDDFFCAPRAGQGQHLATSLAVSGERHLQLPHMPGAQQATAPADTACSAMPSRMPPGED